MANSVKLEIMTPSKLFYRGDVELVIVRTLEGDEGFMAGHTWACKLLDIGELYIQEAGADKEQYKVAAVSGGFIDVKDSIIIYTDHIEWSEDIDSERSMHEKANAQAWLDENKDTASPADIEKAELAIAKAKIRASVAEGGRRRKK